MQEVWGEMIVEEVFLERIKDTLYAERIILRSRRIQKMKGPG